MRLNNAVRPSLGTRTGRRKKLFAIAIEKGKNRTPDILYTHAEKREDVLANLVNIRGAFPKRTKVVSVAEAVGFLADEKGRVLV